jgi:hypothetical protein
MLRICGYYADSFVRFDCQAPASAVYIPKTPTGASTVLLHFRELFSQTSVSRTVFPMKDWETSHPELVAAFESYSRRAAVHETQDQMSERLDQIRQANENQIRRNSMLGRPRTHPEKLVKQSYYCSVCRRTGHTPPRRPNKRTETKTSACRASGSSGTESSGLPAT